MRILTGIVLLLGTMLAGCGRGAAAPAATAPASTPYVKRLTSVTDASRDLGVITRFNFEFLPPPNTRHIIWVETYHKGQLEREATWGCEESGDPTATMFTFQRFDPDVISETKTARARWQINFPDSHSYHWIDDPFKKLRSGPAYVISEHQWPVAPGVTYPVAIMAANEGDSISMRLDDEKFMRGHADVCVIVKVRFEPTAAASSNSTMGRSFSGPPRFDEAGE